MRFHEDQRTFVNDDGRSALAWHMNRLGFGCNGGSNGSHFVRVGVHPLQTCIGGHRNHGFHWQLKTLHLGHAGGRR